MRFHCWQSIFLGAAWVVIWVVLMVLRMIPGLNLLDIILAPLVGLGFLLLWLIVMINAFTGKMIRLPVIAALAAKQSGM